MSLFDPEKPPAFNGLQSSPRRSFETGHQGRTAGAAAAVPRHSNNKNDFNIHNHQQQYGRTTDLVPDRISALYRRYRENNACSQSSSSHNSSLTSSSSSRSDIIEMLFTRIVDALIFTSAIAITAYNYWIGALDNSAPQASLTASSHYHQQTQQQPVLDIRQWRQTHAPKLNHDAVVKQHDFLEDSKRQRTQRWAETLAVSQQHQQQQSNHHQQHHRQHSRSSSRSAQKTKMVQFPNNDTIENDNTEVSVPTKSATDPTQAQAQAQTASNKKRRTQSLPPPKTNPGAQAAQEKQDEMFARMEERLQSLIEEGQAALTSKVELYELDEKEIAMRRAFAARKKHSV
ncbi:hypothetical protein BDB00DRAFT_866488 [Zychaea mexicana]|uniref:uncharacterized protein n=1 Tax=Zychaea mexicana TaxID=64656 RepID=UPI0022FEDCF8|nr:uncharacterized protein BDB00DRAFT_866488 [Zychaea mexicana]KAI9499625.1 hypothetical protein BDB00DRAFT_866488 [Zychaea mexicana]